MHFFTVCGGINAKTAETVKKNYQDLCFISHDTCLFYTGGIRNSGNRNTRTNRCICGTGRDHLLHRTGKNSVSFYLFSMFHTFTLDDRSVCLWSFSFISEAVIKQLKTTHYLIFVSKYKNWTWNIRAYSFFMSNWFHLKTGLTFIFDFVYQK